MKTLESANYSAVRAEQVQEELRRMRSEILRARVWLWLGNRLRELSKLSLHASDRCQVRVDVHLERALVAGGVAQLVDQVGRKMQ